MYVCIQMVSVHQSHAQKLVTQLSYGHVHHIYTVCIYRVKEMAYSPSQVQSLFFFFLSNLITPTLKTDTKLQPSLNQMQLKWQLALIRTVGGVALGQLSL